MFKAVIASIGGMLIYSWITIDYFRGGLTAFVLQKRNHKTHLKNYKKQPFFEKITLNYMRVDVEKKKKTFERYLFLYHFYLIFAPVLLIPFILYFFVQAKILIYFMVGSFALQTFFLFAARLYAKNDRKGI